MKLGQEAEEDSRSVHSGIFNEAGGPKQVTESVRQSRFMTLIFVFDVAAWGAGLVFAAFLGHNHSLGSVSWSSLGFVWLIATCLFVLVGMITGVYSSRYRIGHFPDIWLSTATFVAVGALLWALLLVAENATHIPRSAPLLATGSALLMMVAVRYAARHYTERTTKRDRWERVLIVGVGDVASRLAIWMRTYRASSSDFVGFVSLPGACSGRDARTRPVLGTTDRIAELIARERCTRVVVAVADSTDEKIAQVVQAVERAGATCVVLPPIASVLKTPEAVAHFSEAVSDAKTAERLNTRGPAREVVLVDQLEADSIARGTIYGRAKRGLDIVIVVFALPILIVPMIWGVMLCVDSGTCGKDLGYVYAPTPPRVLC